MQSIAIICFSCAILSVFVLIYIHIKHHGNAQWTHGYLKILVDLLKAIATIFGIATTVCCMLLWIVQLTPPSIPGVKPGVPFPASSTHLPSISSNSTSLPVNDKPLPAKDNPTGQTKPTVDSRANIMATESSVTQCWHDQDFLKAVKILDAKIQEYPDTPKYRELYHTISSLWYEKENGKIPLQYKRQWLLHLDQLQAWEDQKPPYYVPDKREESVDLKNMADHLRKEIGG